MTRASPSSPEHEPIFIVGLGRSGTTLPYEMLARHRDLTWFSTWTDRSRRPELAVFNRLFKAGWHSRRYGPRPAEGYRLWDAALELPPGLTHARLTGEHATPQVARRVGRLIDRHRRFADGSVFLSKTTRYTRGILFLRALYPGARFIHVLRFPLDTISSLIETPWWKDLPLPSEGGATPRSLCADPVDEARVAARQWAGEVGGALEDSRRLRADQYTEVRYEDLVDHPAALVAELLDWLGLRRSTAMVAALSEGASNRSVGAYERRLSSDQIRVAWSTVEGIATRLDYSR